MNYFAKILWIFSIISITLQLSYSKHAGRGIQKQIDNIKDEIEFSFEPPPSDPSHDEERVPLPKPLPLPPTSSLGVDSLRPSFAQLTHIKANRENPAPHLLTRAIAIVRGSGPVKGILYLEQMRNGPVLIHGTLNGFPKAGKYGFHFHQFPVEGDDCESAGQHLNPFNNKHGGKDDLNRHLGDLGNLHAQYHGQAHITISDALISLSGPNSVLGRSIVIHENQDDLGHGHNTLSQQTGNSGDPIGCGNVVLLTPPLNQILKA